MRNNRRLGLKVRLTAALVPAIAQPETHALVARRVAAFADELDDDDLLAGVADAAAWLS